MNQKSLSCLKTFNIFPKPLEQTTAWGILHADPCFLPQPACSQPFSLILCRTPGHSLGSCCSVRLERADWLLLGIQVGLRCHPLSKHLLEGPSSGCPPPTASTIFNVLFSCRCLLSSNVIFFLYSFVSCFLSLSLSLTRIKVPKEGTISVWSASFFSLEQ